MNELFALTKPAGRPEAAETPHSTPPHSSLGRLVGRSQVMRDAILRLRSVAARDVTVLLEGPSGAGKDLAALSVHEASDRREKPFVLVDCGSLSRLLVEAELFDAFVTGDGGTVFLDDVGALELELQPRLARVIERREVKRPGATSWRPVDVRIIASSSRDLAREAARGGFRADLYYRLAVTCVRLPALAERPEDIPLLCRQLAAELRGEGPPRILGEEEIERLAAREWPGNVRELRNAVERLLTMGADQLPPAPPAAADVSFHEAKAQVLADFERKYLVRVMERHDGNITAAAFAARVDRVHFLRLLDKHNMRRPRAPRP